MILSIPYSQNYEEKFHIQKIHSLKLLFFTVFTIQSNHKFGICSVYLQSNYETITNNPQMEKGKQFFLCKQNSNFTTTIICVQVSERFMRLFVFNLTSMRNCNIGKHVILFR